jgi:hypothetical protein
VAATDPLSAAAARTGKTRCLEQEQMPLAGFNKDDFGANVLGNTARGRLSVLLLYFFSLRPLSLGQNTTNKIRQKCKNK